MCCLCFQLGAVLAVSDRFDRSERSKSCVMLAVSDRSHGPEPCVMLAVSDWLDRSHGPVDRSDRSETALL